MSSEWRVGTWGELASLEYGKAIRDYQEAKAPYRVYGTNGPIGWHDTPLCSFPSVIIGRKGAYRGVHYSPEPFFVIDTAFFLKPKVEIDTKWAYYCLLTYDINGMDSGSAIPSTSRDEFYKLSVRVPPIAEQQAIAEILSLFDARIDLLREINTTLESIAQTIFKSWFIDFDPVRAKAEGREPEGLDADTAALFADRFEQSQLGLVPKGWQVGSLEDLLVLQRGFDLPNAERVPGAYPIVAASGPAGSHAEAKVSGPGVITGRSGVLGRVFLELDSFWPLNTTLWVKEFRGASPCYAYELLKIIDLHSFNAGSAVPTLNRNHVHSLKQLLPSRPCVEKYEAIAMSLHERMRVNAAYSDSLREIRDALLPRLISGRIDLSELSRASEEILQ